MSPVQRVQAVLQAWAGTPGEKPPSGVHATTLGARGTRRRGFPERWIAL